MRLNRSGVVLCAASWMSLCVTGVSQKGAPVPDSPRMPTVFVENQGQWVDEVEFLARWDGVSAWLEQDAVRLLLQDPLGCQDVGLDLPG